MFLRCFLKINIIDVVINWRKFVTIAKKCLKLLFCM